MKKLLLVAALLAPSLALAAEIPKFPHGYISPNGDQLNKMVDTINGITGNGGAVTSGYFSLNTGTKTGPTPAAGTIIQAVGANAAATARIEIDAFGGIPVFTARRADGTKAAPTALVSTDEIGSFNFHGAISTTAYGPGARMSAFATENWSGTASGSKIVFSTTPNTTQTLTDALTINQDQTVTLVGGVTGTTFSGTGGLTSRSATATPAAASSVSALTFGSAGIGVYWGTGAPSFSSVKGSLYIQTDGSTTATRLYINNGTTAWVAITTAS